MKNLKILNKSNFGLPEYATEGSAGFDLKANIEEIIYLKPLERKLIKTGLFMEIPEGYVGYVCTRSGRSLKEGLAVINAPGILLRM